MNRYPEPRVLQRLPGERANLTQRMAVRNAEVAFETRAHEHYFDRAIAAARDVETVMRQIAGVFDETTHEMNRFALAALSGKHGRRIGRQRKQLRRKIREHDRRQRIEAQASYAARRQSR